MPSRFERAASLIDGHNDRFGSNGEEYQDVIHMLRLAHEAVRDGRTLEELVDEMASFVEEVYTPTSVRFDIVPPEGLSTSELVEWQVSRGINPMTGDRI